MYDRHTVAAYQELREIELELAEARVLAGEYSELVGLLERARAREARALGADEPQAPGQR